MQNYILLCQKFGSAEKKPVKLFKYLRKLFIKRKNSWCGLDGVRLANNAITKFWKIGGFIPGVRISSKKLCTINNPSSCPDFKLAFGEDFVLVPS